jgi:membrane protein implicated in regulation of membrane protease activity
MDEKVWLIWFIIGVVFIVLEMLTAGFFIFWFGIGALVAALLAYLKVNIVWQWTAFIVISGGLLALSRRFAEKVSGKQQPGIGADRMLGKEGIVIEEIDSARGRGSVKVAKEEWRAQAKGGEIIPAGAKIVVREVEGTYLVVEAIKN